MRRRLLGKPSLHLCIFATLLGTGCKEKPPWTYCDPEVEEDFAYGDRCARVLDPNDIVQTIPTILRLRPAIDGTPSTGRLTVIGYKAPEPDHQESDLGTAAEEVGTVPADGYFVDIAIRETEDVDCNLGLSLAPAPGSELCVIETSSRLRCLLDATGVTEIDVSTTLDHAELSQCEIEAFSGVEASDDTTVKVTHDNGDPNLAIHLGIADALCGGADNPCVVRGGALAADTCTTDAPECASGSRTSLRLAAERGGVQVPLSQAIDIELEATPADESSGVLTFSSSPSCDDGGQRVPVPVDVFGQSESYYLCTDGRAATYEIRANSHDGSLSDSIFVSFPPVPARLAIRDGIDDTEGTTGGSVASYEFFVADCQGAALEEPLEVILASGQVLQVLSGTAFAIDDGSTSLTVSFGSWNHSCTVDLPSR